MKSKYIILILGFLLSVEAIPQKALVLKDTGSGREWLISKGKRLVLAYPSFYSDYMNIMVSGPLISFTDSSLTIYDAIAEKQKTILLKDIGEVKVSQTKAGKYTGGFFLGTGGLCIIFSPFAGKQEHAPYNWTATLTTFGMGAIMAAAGYLIYSPYTNAYTISGTCLSRNERFLRNKNGKYFLSMGFGFGASYGGIGFRTQARLGGITGVGFHLGGGSNFPYPHVPADKVLLDNTFNAFAGVKFFPYRGWYLDAQFGHFGDIATVRMKDNALVIYHVESHYGFVFSAGGDWYFGRHLGLNIGFGAALDLAAPKSSNTFPVFDLGFLVKL